LTWRSRTRSSGSGRPRSSWRRFCADQPNERWQADITHWRLADDTEVEILNILDDHSRVCIASIARLVFTGTQVWQVFLAAIGRAHRPRRTACHRPHPPAALHRSADRLGGCHHTGAVVAGDHRWLHMLGFRGHFATKSRRYSVTLGRLRGERRSWRQRHSPTHRPDLDDQDHDQTTLVVTGTWQFVGLGWLTIGDAALAASAAARAREHREHARSADQDHDDL
jgi:hypothetical protein